MNKNNKSNNNNQPSKSTETTMTYKNMVLDVAPRSLITLNRFKELFEIRVNYKAPKCLWIINSDPEPTLEIPVRPIDDSCNLVQKEYLQSKQNYNNKLEKYKDEKIIFV